MAVEGDLKDISLVSLVQMFCLEQRQVSLLLRNRREDGAIFFNGGEIIHATTGPLEGEEAVYQLLSWTEGTFRVSNRVTASRQTVAVTWNLLLMEGMRRIDEQENENATQARDKKVLAPAEIEQDNALENDLILLLSRLEHSRVRLDSRRSQRRPALALQILAEMVNHVVAFSEEWLDVEARANSLAKALAWAADVHPQVRLLHVQNNRLSAQTMSNLYSSWTSDSVERRETFHQIARGMVDVLETYFSLLADRFRSPSIADRWREPCRIFLADLTPVLKKIPF